MLGSLTPEDHSVDRITAGAPFLPILGACPPEASSLNNRALLIPVIDMGKKKQFMSEVPEKSISALAIQSE